MRNAVKYLLTGLNAVAVLLLAAAYVSSYIPPDRWWLPVFMCFAYPFVLAINFMFVAFWLFTKPKYMVMSLAAIILGAGFLARCVQFRGKTTGEEGIRTMSFNVHHFEGNANTSPASASAKIVDFLEEQNNDIICLQEVRLNRNNIFNLPQTVARLHNINHYQYARSSSSYGLVTMTRYPIVFMDEIRFEDTRNMAIYTDVVIEGDTVRIFNVHLQSYLIDPNDYSVIDSPDFRNENTMTELRELTVKIKTASEMRAGQVRKIREYIDKSPYKVIVCGDFNDTPYSYSYQKIRGRLKDAFVESGRGAGNTYTGKIPPFRIDYILHSSDFKAFNFKTTGFRISDHLPISCTLINKTES